MSDASGTQQIPQEDSEEKTQPLPTVSDDGAPDQSDDEVHPDEGTVHRPHDSPLLDEDVYYSKRVTRHLLYDEEILQVVNFHIVSALQWWLLAALSGVGLILVFTFTEVNWWVGIGLIVAWLAVNARGLYEEILRRVEPVVITTGRVFLIEGFFTTEVKSMPLHKITDVTYSVPWHSKLLHRLGLIRHEYWHFVLETAGQDQAFKEIKFVPRGEDIFNAIAPVILAISSGDESELVAQMARLVQTIERMTEEMQQVKDQNRTLRGED